jgi:hypothetical protein
MLTRIALALAIWLAGFSVLWAATTIRVVRDQKGDPPVAGARIEVCRVTDISEIENGVTDKAGVFTAKKLPGGFNQVCVVVYPPHASGLQGLAKNYPVAAGAVITIRLSRKIR